MCQRCGCKQLIKEGKEAIRKRVVDIVKELRLTPANVDEYENTEVISALIAPFGLRKDEVYQTASWVSGLHEGVPQANPAERYQAHVCAFRDFFLHPPVHGAPSHITQLPGVFGQRQVHIGLAHWIITSLSGTTSV